MIEYLNSLIDKYRSKGIIIDTEIMLVYIVGSYDINYISKFKRTHPKYNPDDYKSISKVLSCFRKKIVTPHILAELSNLSFQAREEKREDYFKAFSGLLKRTSEDYIDKDTVLTLPLLSKIGVTDLGIIEAAKKFDYLVFTDDFPMTGLARKKGIDVLNLNDIRAVQRGMK